MNKLVSVLALVLLLQGAAFAQTASERRNARQKNEANAKDFDSKDPLFKPATIPQKWLNRSAVVIAERVDFDYGGTTNGYFVGKIRRQIKLLDQAAVEEFGSFNFSEDENNRTGIQIIKADGKKVIIDMKAATPFKEELSSRKTRRWNTYVRGGKNQRKIAISGLEVGDIIDILTEIKTDYSPVLLPECSDIINIPFAEEYPIMKKHIQFTVRRGTAISAISTNGAPKIKLVSEPKGRSQTYVAEGEMFEDDTLNNRYTYGLQSAPQVKFQICATGGLKIKYDHFIGEPGEIKSKVEDAEFQPAMINAYVYRLYNQSKRTGNAIYLRYTYEAVAIPYAKEYISWLKTHFKKEPDPVKVADALYYKIRYDFKHGDYREKAMFLNDELFATIFLHAFKTFNKKADMQLAVAPGRQITNREQLLSRSELYWIPVLNHNGKNHFYYPVSDYRKPNDVFYNVAGVEAIVIYINRKDIKNKPFTKVRIPALKAEESGITFTAQVNINADNDLDMDVTSAYRGASRISYSGLFLYNSDFSKEEEANLATLTKEKKKPSASEKRDQQKEKVSKDFDKAENEKEKLDKLKERLTDYYGELTYSGYRIENAGILPGDNAMIVNEKFTISDIVAKAGPNYIVSVGKLIGEYSRIDTSVKRINPISVDFPFSNRLEYNINIPAGYKAEGIAALNTEVSNSTGIFKTTASIEGSVLKIVIERSILKTEMPVTDWSAFTQFINAPITFNQKKFVLKKI